MTHTILVVDDSMVMRRQVRAALASGGYSVIEAVDGLDAFAQLSSETVGLVICDVSMPRMGGLEFLETLRATGQTVPVVILTTEAQPDVVARARQLGVKGWLTKPLAKELLLSLARHLLSGPAVAAAT